MLIINTKPSQTIKIGKYRLELLDISYDDSSIDLRLYSPSGTSTAFSLSVGTSIQLVPDVMLFVSKVIKGTSYVVSLGFDAPRNIKIAGEWFRNQKTTPSYSQYTDKEIVKYAEHAATTPLERELIERLAMYVD